MVAKKTRSRTAAARQQAQHEQIAHTAAAAALDEQSRKHTIEILSFADGADIFLDGYPVKEFIPAGEINQIQAILAKVGEETRAFTVVRHDHSGLSRGE